MINLAESKKAPKWFIFLEIILDWFQIEVNRYKFAKGLVSDMSKQKFVDKMEYFKGKMESFKGECEKLAKITLQIVQTIKGNDSQLTREWKEKYENFENWFKNSPYDE